MNNSNLTMTDTSRNEVKLIASDQKGMTSLEIAEVTGKQHAHVMRDIRSLLNQGVHESNFGLMYRINKLGNGAERKDPYYELTPKGCLILASGYDAVLREKIIDRLEVLESGKPKVPQSFAEALMLAARQQMQIEEQQKQIEQKEEKNLQLEKQNAKLKPKADFADKAFVMEGKCDIGQAAKILGLPFGRNTLFKKLREAGVFFANRNEPKQKYIDAGYFEIKEKPIPRENHPGFVVMVVLCTQKGLAYINHLFGGKPSDGKLMKIS